MNTPPSKPEPVPDLLLGLYANEPPKSRSPRRQSQSASSRRWPRWPSGSSACLWPARRSSRSSSSRRPLVMVQDRLPFIGLMGDDRVAKKVEDILGDGNGAIHTDAGDPKPSLRDRITDAVGEKD